jgi:hypothetical protein
MASKKVKAKNASKSQRKTILKPATQAQETNPTHIVQATKHVRFDDGVGATEAENPPIIDVDTENSIAAQVIHPNDPSPAALNTRSRRTATLKKAVSNHIEAADDPPIQAHCPLGATAKAMVCAAHASTTQ